MSGTSPGDEMKTIQSIMEGVRTCMLTTVSADGSLQAHPMTTQEAEFDGDAWFLLGRDSQSARDVAASSHVNVSYAGASAWLSLAGTAEVVHDQAKKAELWNTFVEAWFPDGRDDPSVEVLRVRAESAQYWNSPNRVAMTVSML